MTSGRRAIVKELPEKLKQEQAHLFFQELRPLLETNRAYLVFDFSRVREIDSAGVGVLLRCLEEAMKGNGDIKLAALPPEAAVILELTGVDGLFEIFENTSVAVDSFQAFSGQTLRTLEQSEYSTFAHDVSSIPVTAHTYALAHSLEGS